ncbi:MAG: acetate uptake transporter [Clostridia bacterium]|nr:acetate uptake transporter [Clostridia bacterium]
MSGKLANPAPLGLAGFAFTTWMLSMINAGWYTADDIGLVLALAFAYGGLAQLVAGVLEYPRGNTFGTVAFFSYGAFWVSLALFFHLFDGRATSGFLGWYLLVWGVFTFYMWLGTFRLNMAVQLVFLALWVTFVLLALGSFGVEGFTTIGGYVGLVTAIIAFYTSAAEVINEVNGREVLPVRPFGRREAGGPGVAA